MHTLISDLPVELAAGDLVTRYAEFGDMAIRHATVPAGTDMTPVLQGLPGDRCPSPHWGMVLDGSITMRTPTARRRPSAPARSTTGQPATPASRTTAWCSSRSDR